jgi:hypothetical protein
MLTDTQRTTLLTNLLQSNSRSMPGQPIGRAKFLIGGDRRTPPLLMSQLLQACRVKGSLHTQEQIHNPTFGRHGDLCFLGGFERDLLSTTTAAQALRNMLVPGPGVSYRATLPIQVGANKT